MTRPRKGPPRGLLVAFGVVAVLGVGLWLLSRNIAGVNMNEPPASQVNLLPPPPPTPPPPPPPKEKPPEPDKAIEPPKPEAQPKAADQPKQLTIAGPAQAGGDSFGVKAGSGGGSTIIGGSPTGKEGGGGFADASWGRFVTSEITRVIEANNRVNHRVFAAVVDVWVDASGRLTKATIRKSSGDPKLDHDLVASVEGIGSLGEPPPASLRFPARIALEGKPRA